MLRGRRTKTKKATGFHVDFSIHIQDIKPWPPSPSLMFLNSVVLFWENGERGSGVTNTVAPFVGPSPKDGRIEFNESFIVQASFQREEGSKGTKIQKNLLEFNIYEPKREKTKGHLLGSSTVDLAEYAYAGELTNVSLPLTSKKSGKSNAQPFLNLTILPLTGDNSGRSSRDGPTDSKESLSTMMSEEYSEDAEIASFTDDDNEFSPPRPSSLGVRDLREVSKETNMPTRLSSVTSRVLRSNVIDTPAQLLERPRIGDSSSSKDVSSEQPVVVEKNEVQNSSVEAHNDQPTTAVQPSILSRNGRKMSFAYGGSSSAQKQFGERTYSMLGSERTRNLRLSMKISSSSQPIKVPVKAPNDQEKEDVKEVVDTKVVLANTTPETDAEEEVAAEGSQDPIQLTTNRNNVASNKLRELEQRVELLEGELREAAAAEISLYSVIAEHGSSAHKVHTSARRLSRLHIHSTKNWTKEMTGRVARSAASGIVLVAKACGSDVPRLTFWLSNTIVLRAIVSKQSDIAQTTGFPVVGDPKSSAKKNPTSMWESLNRKKGKLITTGQFDEWDNPETFISALKKIESWLFSRIVESVWWQCFTPNMQAARKSSESKSGTNKKMYGRITIVGDQKQANLSIDIWKRAFKEAAERLCPVRAAGHECGCMPTLGRLVMEQCITRLDVAMFNAIMRESADEIPSDPMSDPITDPKVLPIPFGKSSFGAGVQLKNAIGSWLRGLTDLFGMDADDGPKTGSGKHDESDGSLEPFRPFRLLNALSDLLMLPKYMLQEKAIRKEVCPTFGSSIIKKVVDRFVVDEFCPEPVPVAVLDALDSEDHLEKNDEGVRVVPCKAAPITYAPPSPALVESVVGEVRNAELRKSGSSVVRKSHTSDDELDDLDSPLMSLSNVPLTPLAKIKRISNYHNARYKLLHDAWKIDD